MALTVVPNSPSRNDPDPDFLPGVSASPDASARPIVLVVDDMPENIAVLTDVLSAQYLVKPAANGELALRIASMDPRPDIILLEIMMPGMDGYEVIRRLKAVKETRDIPVIFVTARGEGGHEVVGLQMGAVDFILRPFNPIVVRARVESHLALRDSRRRLEILNRHLLEERGLLESIVNRMRGASSFDPRHLRYLMTSVEDTNGDLLLAAFRTDGSQWVLVGDMAGHGISAAVCAPLVAYMFYSMAAGNATAQDAFAEINRVMYQFLPTEIYLAACLVDIAADRHSARIWNAGMPGCATLGADGMMQHLGSHLFPLGVVAAQDIDGGVLELDLAPGSRVLLFSDGVSELRSPSEEAYGTDRIGALLHESDADADLSFLLPLLHAFQGQDVFSDDVTIVEIQGFQ